MKKHLIVWVAVLGVLLLIAAFLFWYSNSELPQESITPTPSPSNNGSTALTSTVPTPTTTPIGTYPTSDDVAEEMKWINTPINFWGKVVDEEGGPIPDVTVSYTAMDKPLAQLVRDQGTRYAGKSDANGLFSITGIKGVGLGIEVTKEGYYQTEQSIYAIGYAGPTEHPPPSARERAIFVLRKMGETEPLIAFSSGGIRVPKNGQPVEVSMAQGRVVPAGQGDIQVEVWTQDQKKDEQKRYPWKCRISVPGGGLVERTDTFEFMAPTEGYEPAFEISMDQAADRWQKGFDGQYFAKLKNGAFARFTLKLTTGGDHFFMIESYHNPKPGHRNLEFDPKKAIKVP